MINPDVIVQEVEDGAVLLHMGDGIYFGLNPIGLKFWRHLEKGKPVPEIVEDMNAQYDVTHEKMNTDLINLFEQLKERGLVISDSNKSDP